MERVTGVTNGPRARQRCWTGWHQGKQTFVAPLSPMLTRTSAILLAACLWRLTAPAQQMNVLEVGTRSHLFVDRQAVYEARGVSFTPHPARKHPQPLMVADRPWEGWYVSPYCGTVLYDAAAQTFRMWYYVPGNPEWFANGHTCFATSTDGLHWEKPNVGTIPSRTGQPHNVVSELIGASVFLDPADADPARRYKMITLDKDCGYLACLSPDGLHWKEQSPRAFLPISYTDDVVTGFRDRQTGDFVALAKMGTPVLGRMRRTIYSSTSGDFRRWSRLEPAFVADLRDDLGTLPRLEQVKSLLHHPVNLNVMRTEWYGGGAYPAESCVVAFPWAFSISANVPGKHNQDGTLEPQLAVTRDLVHWERPFRTASIPLGQPGEWDGGMIATASQAIDVGDEVWLYYGGARHTHGSPGLYGSDLENLGKKYTVALGLAVWPRERFVSADAAAEGGTLTTVPLRFAGRRLELNAAIKDSGEIRVELLDAGGRPLPSLGASAPLHGDQLRHQVKFDGAAQLGTFAGQIVTLRFHLKSAELYSFAFRD